jgi:hypothetical protein
LGATLVKSETYRQEMGQGDAVEKVERNRPEKRNLTMANVASFLGPSLSPIYVIHVYHSKQLSGFDTPQPRLKDRSFFGHIRDSRIGMQNKIARTLRLVGSQRFGGIDM